MLRPTYYNMIKTKLPSRSRKAFTLIELILVISLIAILIALLLPSISHLRNRAYTAGSLSNLRNHAAVMEMYTNDHQDTYPIYVDPKSSYGVLYWNNHRIVIKYFDQEYLWMLFVKEYYHDNPLDPSFFVPGPGALNGDYAGVHIPYRYSSTFFTDPKFWQPETRLPGHTQWRPVKNSEVNSPSQKGILISENPRYNTQIYSEMLKMNVDIAFTNGHAENLPQGNLQQPTIGDPPYEGVTFPVINTPDGVRGRDKK